MGRRAQAVLNGEMGPVLKRWIAATILPTAERLKLAANGLLDGERDDVVAALASPVFGIPDISDSRDVRPILSWCLRGSSKGRAEKGTTYAEDLVLAVMSVAVSACAGDGGPIPLMRVVSAAGEAARETGLGQFITQVQGAKAMMRVRGKGAAAWKQGAALDSIAALLAGQVRSGLQAKADEGDGEELELGGREVVMVLTQKGEQRHIELRVPSEGDWGFLEVARHVKGERDQHKGTWTSFAMMVLCAAQAETGMFELVKISRVTDDTRRSRYSRALKSAHGLALTEEAHKAITADLDKWLKLGFMAEPMIVPPVDGDYLTVKHRGIAGGRGPMGIKTQVKGTGAWEVASRVMASTAWQVPEQTLQFLRTDLGRELAEKSEPNPGRRTLINGAYRRLATEEAIYLPIFMDFRGRVYTKPTLVTYQGGDLQKSLLCFPKVPFDDMTPEMVGPLASHLGNLYGHGMDKAPIAERIQWFRTVKRSGTLLDMVAEADEPLQFYTSLTLVEDGQYDRVACQIDGTCNGLQHLSALFRDETAAPFVNLTSGSDRPADIYAEIASRVSVRLSAVPEAWARRVSAAVKIDRKLCKKPVMVLPYGGTRGTIDEAIMESVVEQQGDPTFCPWRECLTWVDSAETHGWIRDEEAVKGEYLVFRDRELKNHPLLRLDCQRLGGIVWDVIGEVLPKPMLAMQAFRDIAKAVGPRSLEWSTSPGGESSLWVIQAKAKSAASTLNLKGLHLPGAVRGMAMRLGKDEVDPRAHVTGIVANFIHSMDAAHLARTMAKFRSPAFGAIHDCYITRPSFMPALGASTRQAFYFMYATDPLSFPVRLRDVKSKHLEEYSSWYALADMCGVTFPEKGTWSSGEVLDSQWFFS